MIDARAVDRLASSAVPAVPETVGRPIGDASPGSGGPTVELPPVSIGPTVEPPPGSVGPTVNAPPGSVAATVNAPPGSVAATVEPPPGSVGPVIDPLPAPGESVRRSAGRPRAIAPAIDAPLAPRERILEVAGELFYREGIRSVGIDTVVARSGVAKMTLYRHFASKDELVVAYLRERDRRYWAWLEAALASGRGPREQLLALFIALGEKVTSDRYRGCPFLNAATEFPDRAHPAVAVVLEHKRAVHARLAALAGAAGADEPERLADQLQILMDGAYASAHVLGPASPAGGVGDIARVLIEAQIPA